MMSIACSQNARVKIVGSPGRDKHEICTQFKSDLDAGYVFAYEKMQTPDAFVTPTKKLSDADYPNFVDDLNFNGIDDALDRQLLAYASMDLSGTIRLGNTKYKLTQARRSLIRFKDLVHEYHNCTTAGSSVQDCEIEFNNKLRTQFNVYIPDLTTGDPRFGEDKPVLFTGYYTPTINVSSSAAGAFQHAIYSLPNREAQRTSTRGEIDFKGAIAQQGYEIFYGDDLFKLYLMHVQGSALVNFVTKGGSYSRYLTYKSTNSQPWSFISKYMRAKNWIADSSIESQRDFLEKNPGLQEEIYSSCLSYVYFSSTSTPPTGSGGVAVTNNRTIATDDDYYKFKGLLAFVSAARPEEAQLAVKACKSINYKPYSRFYLDQDTGGAIRGKGRVDLYFGEGDYAEKAAYNIVQRGDLYFLMLK